MLEKVFYTSVLVGDQDKALDFSTNVVGLEKRVENPMRESGAERQLWHDYERRTTRAN